MKIKGDGTFAMQMLSDLTLANDTFLVNCSIDLPLKVLVWDDQGRTKISYTAPAVLAARHNLDPELAERLAGIHTLTDALAREG